MTINIFDVFRRSRQMTLTSELSDISNQERREKGTGQLIVVFRRILAILKKKINDSKFSCVLYGFAKESDRIELSRLCAGPHYSFQCVSSPAASPLAHRHRAFI